MPTSAFSFLTAFLQAGLFWLSNACARLSAAS
jgi:hypothetical protein